MRGGFISFACPNVSTTAEMYVCTFVALTKSKRGKAPWQCVLLEKGEGDIQNEMHQDMNPRQSSFATMIMMTRMITILR